MENYESFEEQAKRKEERIREYNALKAASVECRYGEQDCASCKKRRTCSRGQFLIAMSR